MFLVNVCVRFFFFLNNQSFHNFSPQLFVLGLQFTVLFFAFVSTSTVSILQSIIQRVDNLPCLVASSSCLVGSTL